MFPYHLQHKIPWNILHEIFEKKGKKKILSFRDIDYSCEGKYENNEKDIKRMNYFCHSFEKAVFEFSETEINKYDTSKIMAMKELYPDDQCNQLMLKEYQTAESWNRYLSENLKANCDSSPFSFGGELSDIIKELFNRNDMYPLLFLSRVVHDIDKLAFITWSNFFHWGYRRVLEDSMTMYFILNFILNRQGDDMMRWKILNMSVSRSDNDHDVSLHYYRKLLLGEENIFIENDRVYSKISEYIDSIDMRNDKTTKITSLSDEQISLAQKFAFRCIYQYSVFWNEVLKYSKNKTLKPINWHVEIVNCLNSLI